MLGATVVRHEGLSARGAGVGRRAAVPRLPRLTGAPYMPIFAPATICCRFGPVVSALNVWQADRRDRADGERRAQADVKLDCSSAALVSRITAKSLQRLGADARPARSSP